MGHGVPVSDAVKITAIKLRNEGFSYAKIGLILGVNKETARSWINPGVLAKRRKIAQAWRRKNPELNAARNRKWRDSDIRRARKRESESRKNRRAAICDYRRKRKATDINYKLRVTLRTRLHCAIRSHAKAGSAVRDLGCSIEYLKLWLEQKFVDGMTWDNHGEWHIDHIKPLASFDLQDRGQLLEACHYTNLQPLWAKDNLAKGDGRKTTSQNQS